jgi:hypothetical protein
MTDSAKGNDSSKHLPQQTHGMGTDGKSYSIPITPSSQFVLKNQKTQSIIVTRTQGKFTPKNQGVFKYGDIMRIEIPSTSWLNTEEFAISFQCEIKKANGEAMPSFFPSKVEPGSLHWIRMKNGIQSIFERIKLTAGSGNPLEDIQNYGLLNLMLLYGSAPKTWVDNIGFYLEGVHSGWNYKQQCIMNTWNHAGSLADDLHEYYIRPHLGLFRTGKFLPMAYLGLLTFEFYFNEPRKALICSAVHIINDLAKIAVGNATPAGGYLRPAVEARGTNALPWKTLPSFWNMDNPIDHTKPFAVIDEFKNAYYEIKNVFAHCVWLNPREELNNAILQKLQSGSGMNLFFETYRHHTRQIPNSWTAENQIIIPERVASLKGVLAAMINEGDDNSMLREIRFNSNNITQYRWRIGDTWYPQVDVNCKNGAIEAYVELLRFFGQDCDVEMDNLIRYENYHPDYQTLRHLFPCLFKTIHARGVGHNDRFFIGANFESSYGQLSGIDTLRMNADVELRYTLDVSSAVQQSEVLNLRRNYVPTCKEIVFGDVYNGTMIPSTTYPVNRKGATLDTFFRFHVAGLGEWGDANSKYNKIPRVHALDARNVDYTNPCLINMMFNMGTDDNRPQFDNTFRYNTNGRVLDTTNLFTLYPNFNWEDGPSIEGKYCPYIITDPAAPGIKMGLMTAVWTGDQIKTKAFGDLVTNSEGLQEAGAPLGLTVSPGSLYMNYYHVEDPGDGANTGVTRNRQHDNFVRNVGVDLFFAPCQLPSYYTWFIFTHFDACLQIQTFGTVAATTDIYHL